MCFPKSDLTWFGNLFLIKSDKDLLMTRFATSLRLWFQSSLKSSRFSQYRSICEQKSELPQAWQQRIVQNEFWSAQISHFLRRRYILHARKSMKWPISHPVHEKQGNSTVEWRGLETRWMDSERRPWLQPPLSKFNTFRAQQRPTNRPSL